MCFIQAQYRIKGGTQGPLFVEHYAFYWSNLIYFTVQNCGDRAGELGDRGREGCCIITKA